MNTFILFLPSQYFKDFFYNYIIIFKLSILQKKLSFNSIFPWTQNVWESNQIPYKIKLTTKCLFGKVYTCLNDIYYYFGKLQYNTRSTHGN